MKRLQPPPMQGEPPAWHNDAACRTFHAELFDDIQRGESLSARDERHSRAFSICAGCPVRSECAQQARDLKATGVIMAGRVQGLADLDPLAKCGTRVARRRHARRGETCTACDAPREVAPHGTHSAFVRHTARREDPCPDCRVAERAYQRGRKRIRRQRLSSVEA